MDFTAAREATELLIQNYTQWDDGNAIRALTTGIVISYARPFGENHGLGSLPGNFRIIPDPDAQRVHDRVLDARDILEAHNNLEERGRLVSSRDATKDPLDIEIHVHNDGTMSWSAATPALRLPEYQRLLKLIRIQEQRASEASASALKDLLRNSDPLVGTYNLTAFK
jgi:hypothetical protein